jgi:hypothetical protein
MKILYGRMVRRDVKKHYRYYCRQRRNDASYSDVEYSDIKYSDINTLWEDGDTGCKKKSLQVLLSAVWCYPY